MTPFMFGPVSRRLFGLFHAADADKIADTAVLICPPFGQEALRAHRLFKVLADRLARRGIASLRFDFYGAGDSPGDESEGELDGWQRDLCEAHEELRRLSSAKRVVWIGARLGAALAIQAAGTGRCDPNRLVLWEPIVDGKQYLRFLREEHVEALDASFCIPDPAPRRALAREPDALPVEALGAEVSPRLAQQLADLGVAALPLGKQHDTIVLANPEDESVINWATKQKESNFSVTLEAFTHPLIWTSDPHPNSAMVPAEALQRLLRTIDE